MAANEFTIEDAGMTIQFHAGRQSPGASEFWR
jgi:hypothetical protein